MDQHLYKYLVLHKHLSIPQLGNFVIQNEQAHYEKGSGLLRAPKPVLAFAGGEAAVSEKAFFDFLAVEMGVDELAAVKLFHDFSYQFRSDLQEKGSVELKGVGVLTREEENTLRFQSTHDLSELLPAVKPGAKTSFTTETAVVTEEIETTEEKDQWWMYAIVLVMLGIGALIVYYS